MLNLLPIQFLALYAYFLLRVVVRIIVLMLGIHIARSASSMSRTLSTRPHILTGVGIGCFLSSGPLLLGLFTQAAALFVAGLALLQLLYPNHTITTFLPQRLFWLLLFSTSVSLFITGAGVLAFDLPI